MPKERAPNSKSLKRQICAFHKDNVLSTHVEVAAHFNIKYNLDIDQTTISKIINEKDERLFIECMSESVLFWQA